MRTNLHITVLLVFSVFFNLTSAQTPTPNWKNIGPIPFPQKTIGQIHGIGRCSQIKFHATDLNKMYAVSASGGLYQSNDKGLNWKSLGTDQIVKAQSASIAVDPVNDQVIYWGTGEGNYSSTNGQGVYKTINGGATWTASNSGMGNRVVIDMLFLPTDHNTIIAATTQGMYKSTDAGANWILKSDVNTKFLDICYKPGTNGQTIYAAASQSFYRSLDAGESWTKITSPAFVLAVNGTRVSVSEADPNVVYVANVGAGAIGEIYRSTDGGSTFTNMRTTTECLAGYSATEGGQGNYNFDFEVNPVNPNELYVCAHVIWRSTDAGATWVKQQSSWAYDLHTDQHHIVFDPYVSGQLWNANDGGVWSNTANGTGAWTPKSDGIAATEIYHGALGKTNRNLQYIGTQDNGGFYYHNGLFYNDRAGDYGPFMWFDYSGNFYSESSGTKYLYPSGPSVSLNPPETPSGGKFAFTPENADIAYHANAGKIYRCLNLTSASPSWALIYTVPSGNIKDLQIDPGNADRLYVFTDLPALYRSDNAKTDASFVQTTLPATSTNGSVAPIPNSDVVYLGLGTTIYRSADKGTTWTTTKGFPAAQVRKVIADSKSTNEAVYASYSLGVYYKDNTKSSWVNYSSDLPIICSITDMDIYNDGISKGILTVYYYGRGVWQSDLVPPPTNITVAITSPVNNTTFSSPATINLNATASVSSGNISKVEFYNGTTLLGTSVSSPYNYSWNGVSSGKYELTAVAYDNLGNKKSSALVTVTVTFVCNKVTGTVFGTAPYYSYTSDKAFDGDINTAFDANSANSAYVGLDLGTAKVVTNIKYYPRNSQAKRMTGGKFQGSNTSTSAGFVDLYTIPTQPDYAWQDVSIPNSTAYRYYRYYTPPGGYADVAEIEFCTSNELPTANITAPINNQLYATAPANINITAAASDIDGSISKVEFYQGDTLLGTATSSPYSFNWTGVPGGTYQLYAKVYDNINATAVSSTITVTVGNQNPTVSIISPDDYAVFTDPANINIYATASDSDGTISKVEFYNGTTLLGTSTTSPYHYNWTNAPIGTYTLTCKAYDNNGGTTSSSPITATVVFPCSKLSGSPFGTAPYYSYSTYDKAFDGDLSTTFQASTTNNGYTGLDLGTAKVLKGIRFYPRASRESRMTGGKFQGSNVADFSSGVVDLYTIPSTPSLTWNEITISNSTAFRYVRYLSPAGGYCNVAEIEFCGLDNTPNISITAPTNAAAYIAPATINITANVNGPISKVEYYIGASLIGTSANSPYNYNWTGISGGTYTLIAKAYDSAGAVISSAPVNFTVINNIAPTVSITTPANNAIYVAPATFDITATTKDTDGSIDKVEFYNGATLLGTVNASPYTFNWKNVAAGTYTLTAKAYDNNGVATTSSAVSVRVNQPPTISITAPTDNTIYAAPPASFDISATANDTDGSIGKVEFYNGTTLLGTVNASPYTFNWKNVAAGTYMLTAKAYDNDGAVTTSSAVSVRVNQSPTVSITTPADNAIYVAPASFDISATANDTDGTINKVEFYNGSTLLGVVNASPYTFNWKNVAAGTYTLTAKAYDNDNDVTTSSAIVITVNTPVNQSPSAAITAPANNTVFIAPASITIDAVAADSDGTISKVEFYNGTTLLSTSTSSPYTYNWKNVPVGTYAITVKSYDDANITATSAVVNIIVTNNQAPTVNITAPVNNTTFIAPANVTINAEAADSDGTISKVEFYNGTTLLSTSITSPYTYNWENVAAGNYAITVKSYDNANATATSAVVNVVVTNNQVPTVRITAPVNNTTFIAPASITINAAAADSDGAISKVEFYNGTTLLSTSTASPYTYNWEKVSVGTYQITAKAIDNTGNVTSSTPVIIVVKARPIISMISSSENNQVIDNGKDILFTFNVTDPDAVLSSIILKDNGEIISTINKSPYLSVLTDISPGDHYFTATAVLQNGTEYTFTSLNIVSKNCKSMAWNTTTDYLIGDQVIYQNIIYRALIINQNKQPDQDQSTWSKIGICENLVVKNPPAIKPKYMLYPNPCTTHFNIKFIDCAGKSFYYSIMDINSRVLREQKSEPINNAIFEKEVTIQGLPSGTYIVHIHLDERIYSEKIIIIEKPSMYKKKR